jgi:hypothetical protein
MESKDFLQVNLTWPVKGQRRWDASLALVDGHDFHGVGVAFQAKLVLFQPGGAGVSLAGKPLEADILTSSIAAWWSTSERWRTFVRRSSAGQGEKPDRTFFSA